MTAAKHSSWICKPVEPSRGTGIIISSDVKDLVFDDTYIERKYTCHPFLVGRGKPDLRICVCITGFKPLTIYVYREGLARFATEKFDLSNLQNSYAPLTNLSINKSGASYEKIKEVIGRATSRPSAGPSLTFAAGTWTACFCGRKSTTWLFSRGSPSLPRSPLRSTAWSSLGLIF